MIFEHITNFEGFQESNSGRPTENPDIIKWYGEHFPIADAKVGQRVTYRGMKYFIHDGSDVHLLLHEQPRKEVPAEGAPYNSYKRVNQSMFDSYCILWNKFDDDAATEKEPTKWLDTDIDKTHVTGRVEESEDAQIKQLAQKLNGTTDRKQADLLRAQISGLKDKDRLSKAKGKTVTLQKMEDPYTKLKSGDKGIIQGVDGAGHILVKWANGSTLNLIPGVDEYTIQE